MTCKEIMEKLEERWNPSYALEWDNVGLLVGREDKEIKKVFTALDATEETIAQALEFGADLLITHHPMLFSPVKKVTSADFIGHRLITMIQADLCYYAMHTNFDVKGMAQLNQECLGLAECEVLEETAPGEGIGRVGVLDAPMDLKTFAEKVRNDFEIPDVRGSGKKRLSCGSQQRIRKKYDPWRDRQGRGCDRHRRCGLSFRNRCGSTGNRCDRCRSLWNRIWIYRIYETGIGSNVSGT